MTGDNPFNEDPAEERTAIRRPQPGGSRGIPPSSTVNLNPGGPPIPQSQPRPATPRGRSGEPAPLSEVDPQPHLGVAGLSPLLSVAVPLLQLIGRLQNTYSPPDPAQLRMNCLQAIKDFETAGRNAGISNDVIHPARYALCASIDDVVMHTAWGEATSWEQFSLVSTLHQEVIAGEGFYFQLNRLKRDPAHNLMLLELMYLCLALGYQGQYRLSRRGPAELELLREDLYQTIIRLRPGYEQALSLQWSGTSAPYRPARAIVPIWVMAFVVVALLGGGWLFLFTSLSNASDSVRIAALAVPPAKMPDLVRPPLPVEAHPVQLPPQPPPPQPAAPVSVGLLRRFLEPEIQQHLVEVTYTDQQVRVRIFSSGMFAVGRATIKPDVMSVLERIGEALSLESGKVEVGGHTDNSPIINRVPFPTNYDLSVARAEAAKAVLAKHIRDPGRLSVKGYADSQPIADNATDQGKAQNRRIDIVLTRES